MTRMVPPGGEQARHPHSYSPHGEQEDWVPYRHILASQSPRRRELLEEAGLAFEPRHPGLDDGVLRPGRVPPQQWVAALAHLKAAATLILLREEGNSEPLLVLGADTMVIKGSEFLGQPRDAEDARRILTRLENGSHQVATGVAILRQAAPGAPVRRTLFVDSARVRIGALGENRIQEYLASGKWKGKAGAYNLLERIDAGWPIEYVGDPATVMGLPMRALIRRLATLELLAS